MSYLSIEKNGTGEVKFSMELYLVRHGETFWNERDLIQGCVDIGLNQTGLRQSQEMATHFPPDKPFDLAVSPLRRARQTAAILQRELTIDNFWILNNLHELDQGFWNGLSGSRLENNLVPEEYRAWKQDPISHSPPAGESLWLVKDRIKKALDFILNQHENRIILVAHKVVNSLIAHLAGRWEFDEVLESLPDNAAVLEVQISS